MAKRVELNTLAEGSKFKLTIRPEEPIPKEAIIWVLETKGDSNPGDYSFSGAHTIGREITATLFSDMLVELVVAIESQT